MPTAKLKSWDPERPVVIWGTTVVTRGDRLPPPLKQTTFSRQWSLARAGHMITVGKGGGNPPVIHAATRGHVAFNARCHSSPTLHTLAFLNTIIPHSHLSRLTSSLPSSLTFIAWPHILPNEHPNQNRIWRCQSPTGMTLRRPAKRHSILPEGFTAAKHFWSCCLVMTPPMAPVKFVRPPTAP